MPNRIAFQMLIEELVSGALKADIAQHQRAIGPKAVRDELCLLCHHDDWDVVLQFCRSCGTTRFELVNRSELLN